MLDAGGVLQRCDSQSENLRRKLPMIEAPHSPDANFEAIGDSAGEPNQKPKFTRDSLQEGVVVAAAVLLLGWAMYWFVDNLRQDQEAANVIVPAMEMPQEGDFFSTAWLEPGGESSVCVSGRGVICFNMIDGKMYLEASRLEPGSIFTITSSAGSLNLDVQPDGMLNVEVSGKIVNESFQARGTWVDGEEAGLNIEIVD